MLHIYHSNGCSANSSRFPLQSLRNDTYHRSKVRKDNLHQVDGVAATACY